MRATIFIFACIIIPFGSISQNLNQDSLMMDIDYLEEILTDIHPGLYRYNSKQDIENGFDELRSRVSHNEVSEKEWMLMLAQTINEIKCGHTYLNPWNMKRSIRERLFGGNIYIPLGFKIIDGEFIVSENLSEEPNIKRGDVISKINSISTSQILDSLMTIAKTDGNNLSPVPNYLSLQNFDIGLWEAFDLYYYLFFVVEGEFKVEVNSETYSLRALSKAERAEKYKGKSSEEWDLSFNEEKVIMRMGTFATWKWKGFDYKAWFANAFQKIDSMNSKYLIIDIRGNGGGLGEIRDELLTYISPESLNLDKDKKQLIRTLKVDDKFKDYSDTWVDWAFTGLSQERYSRFDDNFYEYFEPGNTIEYKAKGNLFTGSVYILGGPSNVSATFQLLQAAKSLDNAFVIGSESGGNQQGINGGEYIFFYLPYSGMEVDIPLKYFYGGPDKIDAGIQADYIVRPSKEAIRDGRDLHFELVDELIANQNQLSEKYIFSLLTSDNWKGKLTYKDYQSGKEVDIPAAMKIKLVKENEISLEYIYPDEPHMNNTSKAKLDLEKKKLEGHDIKSIENENGTVTIIAEYQGKDNGKKADIRLTYSISENQFSMKKEYKGKDTENFKLRNIYSFSR